MHQKKLVVKTITCHDVNNFGASLQAYALMRYLESLGHDVEIIDYKPDYLTFNLWAIGSKWNRNIFIRLLYYSFVVPRRITLEKRRVKFNLFKQTKLKITPLKYNSIDDLKNNIPLAEVYFAGSDQIWNPLLPNGKDPSFFLTFTPKGSIRASYAASFSVAEIPEEIIPEMKKWISDLDFVSVRESSALEILKSLDITNGLVVIDPVYLLSENQWDELIKPYSKEKYIFIYDQENSPLIKKAALLLAKKYDLKIYAIEALYPFRYAHRRIKDAGPEDFISLIRGCEICLTNSFHCISFSVIFQKKFYLFKRTHLKVNSRMVDLLNFIGLQHLIVDEVEESLELIDINYTEAQKKISERINYSFDYIKRVLNSFNNNEA
jgi:hypothetical protein